MDSRSQEILKNVHPKQRELVTRLIANLIALGIDARVTEGLRTAAEQQHLYNQGRTRPGKIVTNAKPWQSNHNFGFANDITVFKNGKPDWSDTKPYQVIGREAEKLGLEWGGRWKAVDMPHVQLKGMSVKECQTAYKNGDLPAVWKRMDQILAGAKPTVFIPKADELIEFGDKGPAVMKLQQDLAKLSFLRAHEIDGEFGKITKNAVVGYQRQNNLTADGIVGPGTQAKLKAALEPTVFRNLQKADLESAVGSLVDPVNSGQKPTAEPVSEKADQQAANQEPPPILDAPQTTGTVSESTTKTVETPRGEVSQTVTATKDIFNPKNIPAFIPRFGKQWLFGLVPGAGFLSTVLAYIQNAPQWLVFLLGALTGIGLWILGQLLITHRVKVIEFITECYKATADPAQNNLIPTNAAEFVGVRQNELVSSLEKK